MTDRGWRRVDHKCCTCGVQSEFEVWDDTGRNSNSQAETPSKLIVIRTFSLKINTLIDFTLRVYLNKLKVIRKHDFNFHHIENVPDIVDFMSCLRRARDQKPIGVGEKNFGVGETKFAESDIKIDPKRIYSVIEHTCMYVVAYDYRHNCPLAGCFGCKLRI